MLCMHRRGRMCALRFLPASLFIRMASWHGQTFLGILMMHLAVIIFIMCPSNLLRSFAQSWDCSPYFSLLFGEERDERKVRVLHAQAFSILLNDVPHDLFWWVVEQNKKTYLILPTRLFLRPPAYLSGSEKKHEHIRPTKAPGNIPKWKNRVE